MPDVSVVIDNYNYGRFLGQAVESVLRQDFRGEIECLVVDDGSNDESRQVIGAFGSRIRSIFQENRGQAAAFNAGFAAAQGDFVCMLDSDDYWSTDKLSETVTLFNDPDVCLVQHYLQDVDARGFSLPRRFPQWPQRYVLDDFLDRRVHFTATSGLTFRKSTLARILPLPEDIFYYLDDLLFVKALFFGKAANLPRALGFHRIHEGNFCAGGYSSPKKLELDLRMRGVFNREIDPLLRERGLKRTERYVMQEDLEYSRRRILLAMYRGERGRAVREWWAMLRAYGGSSFGLFRAASCLPALFSASLYLRLYELYDRRGLSGLRSRLFHEIGPLDS